MSFRVKCLNVHVAVSNGTTSGMCNGLIAFANKDSQILVLPRACTISEYAACVLVVPGTPTVPCQKGRDPRPIRVVNNNGILPILINKINFRRFSRIKTAFNTVSVKMAALLKP